MSKNYFFPLAAFACCLLLLLSQCKENIEPDNTDKNFPVALRMTQKGERVHFEWDVAQVSTFSGYFLVRSITPIETGNIPISAQTIYTTNYPDSTQFEDDNLPLADKLYYKLYVKLSDRFVESAAITVNLDNFLIEGRPNSVVFVPDSNWLVVANAGNSLGSIDVLDLNSKRILASKQNVVVSQPEYTGINVGKDANGALELYYWPSNTGFTRYALPDLAIKQTIASTMTAFSLASNNNGLFFTTQYDYDNAFCSRRTSDFSIVKGAYRSSYYEHRTLKVADAATNRVVEAAPYLITAFNVNAASGTISNTKSVNTNFYYVLPQDIVMSGDKKFIIPQRDGKVYDLETLTEVVQIPQTSSSNSLFIDYAFSGDNKFVYTLNQSAVLFNTTIIEKFSFPELKLITSKSIENVSPTRLISANDGIYFVGSSANNLNKYTVKRLTF